MIRVSDLRTAKFLDGTQLKVCTVEGTHRSGVIVIDPDGKKHSVSPRRVFYSMHRLLKAGVIKADVE